MGADRRGSRRSRRGEAMTHLSDDRLIDLAAGLLTGADASPLLAHMQTCASCEARFREVCAELERPKPGDAAVRRLPTWAGFAVAAAVVLAVVLAPRPDREPAQTLEGYWLPVEAEAGNVRAPGANEDEARIAEATEAYRRQDV